MNWEPKREPKQVKKQRRLIHPAVLWLIVIGLVACLIVFAVYIIQLGAWLL